MAADQISWDQMAAWSRALLVACGLTPHGAACVSDSVVYAERRGFASHGFVRLPTYAARIRAGGINAKPQIRVIGELPSLVVVDADAAAGAESAVACVDLATDRATSAGVGMVIARNANHFGAAGQYSELMASRGFLGVAVCNTDVLMCAPFGGRPVLGSNPLAIAAPATNGVGPHLDMATTEANYGKILVARDHGEQIPLGWAVDADGAPTTDPSSALAGAFLPSGGPKGFGLAFMVECIVAIAGAATSVRVGRLYGDASEPQGLGQGFIAIAVDVVQTRNEYGRHLAQLTADVHASKAPSSTRAPMVPGEPEDRRLASAALWSVDGNVLTALAELSTALDVPIPEGVGSTDPSR